VLVTGSVVTVGEARVMLKPRERDRERNPERNRER
jgi:hypothetical protein